jgi:hypothetical protein
VIEPVDGFIPHWCVINPEQGNSDGYVVGDSSAITDVVKKPEIAGVRETNGVIMPGLIDMHNTSRLQRLRSVGAGINR